MVNQFEEQTAQQITLKISTQGGDEHDIEAPPDISVADFLIELTTALDLPATDSESNLISWRLDNKDLGRTMDPNKSLADNGVRDQHRLSLLRQVTAGRSWGGR